MAKAKQFSLGGEVVFSESAKMDFGGIEVKIEYTVTKPSQERGDSPFQQGFSKNQDKLSVDEMKVLQGQQDTQKEHAYHLAISPKPEDGKQMSREQLQEWTKGVMQDLETKRGEDMKWIASISGNKDHPQVNITAWSNQKVSQEDMKALRENVARPLEQGYTYRPSVQAQPEPERQGFSKTQEKLSGEEMKVLAGQQGSQNKQGYEMNLTPNPTDAKKMTPEELQSWTKGVMQDLETRSGQDLKWVATIEGNKDHPQVHVKAWSEGQLDPQHLKALNEDTARSLAEGHSYRSSAPVRSEAEVQGFSKTQEKLSGEEMKVLAGQQGSQNKQGYETTLTPNHADAKNMTPQEVQSWTKGVMQDLETRSGQDLKWVATVEGTRDQPQVQVTAWSEGKLDQQHLKSFGEDASRSLGDNYAYRSSFEPAAPSIANSFPRTGEAAEGSHGFSKNMDHISSAEMNVLQGQQDKQKEHSYTIALSPNQADTKGMSSEQLQSWTKEVMTDFEARRGEDLKWVAVADGSKDQPQVHVTVWSDRKIADGELKELRENENRSRGEDLSRATPEQPNGTSSKTDRDQGPQAVPSNGDSSKTDRDQGPQAVPGGTAQKSAEDLKHHARQVRSRGAGIE
jgi:hypothetical protein